MSVTGQKCLRPWLQLSLETALAMHQVWCEEGSFSLWGLPSKAFVNIYSQAWKIANRFLTRSQTPHLGTKLLNVDRVGKAIDISPFLILSDIDFMINFIKLRKFSFVSSLLEAFVISGV